MAVRRETEPATAGEAGLHPDGVSTRPTSLHTERLHGLLGRDLGLAEVERTLRMYVQDERAPVVGAMHVTCSDEAERECVEAFQRNFVHYLLPQQKFFSKAAFRVANLGARYEWGSVRIADGHFALAKGAEKWKLMVVKINAHVSVERTPEGVHYGHMRRYDSESVYCGALDALLEGESHPFVDDLAESFGLEGVDRLTPLRDPAQIDPAVRNLLAAATSARLQARRAMIDIQDYEPAAPTLFLVLPCVTLNRRDHDTEILCGIYTADRRGPEPHEEYCGLGDRPEQFRLRVEGETVTLKDDSLHRPRRPRDHRALVLSTWRSRERPKPETHERLESELQEASKKTEGRHHPLARAALKSLLVVASEVAPIPLALLLFGEGLVGVHHTARAHSLAREAEGDETARHMLRDIQHRVDDLPPEQAQHLVSLLAREYGR